MCAQIIRGLNFRGRDPGAIGEYPVWPEILVGRYFGGLLKICHLAEFTLAVEPSHNDIMAKWLMKRAGNLSGP